MGKLSFTTKGFENYGWKTTKASRAEESRWPNFKN
jgi:hypothetical protein